VQHAAQAQKKVNASEDAQVSLLGLYILVQRPLLYRDPLNNEAIKALNFLRFVEVPHVTTHFSTLPNVAPSYERDAACTTS
jgi:hypothetical protein